MSVAIKVVSTLNSPPTFRFSTIPAPPATCRAPVVVLVDVVVSEMCVDSVTRAPTLAVPRISKTFALATAVDTLAYI